MIQRKQSVFLLISALLIISTLFIPFLQISDNTGSVCINAFEIANYESDILEESVSIKTIGITIIAIAIGIIVSIFLFSKRLLQIKIIRYAIILKCTILAILAYYIYILSTTNATFSITPKTGTLFMVITLVLDWLAIRGIKKDDELVKSINRIR